MTFECKKQKLKCKKKRLERTAFSERKDFLGFVLPYRLYYRRMLVLGAVIKPSRRKMLRSFKIKDIKKRVIVFLLVIIRVNFIFLTHS